MDGLWARRIGLLLWDLRTANRKRPRTKRFFFFLSSNNTAQTHAQFSAVSQPLNADEGVKKGYTLVLDVAPWTDNPLLFAAVKLQLNVQVLMVWLVGLG